MNLVPGTPVYVIVASLELSIIVFMLAWHHLFEDYPSATVVKNTAWRVLSRVAIWLVGGTIYGVIWLKTYKSLPIGGNSLGMGFPDDGYPGGAIRFADDNTAL